VPRIPAVNRSRIDPRQDLGRRGEEAAARWYVAAGYEIVARNWRCPGGEIDLVVMDPGGGIVFCEVKTRSSTAFGSPEEAVTVAKQCRLRRLAAQWLSDRRTNGAPTRSVRFDVAAVMVDRAGALAVDVTPDAF
jgi:putative endonuclease